MDTREPEIYNRATRVVTSTLGVFVGLAGIDHGIFEILQGNLATNSVMIAAIGSAQRFWQYGDEPALTIIPNFLATGILAVIFGILLTIWSIKFIGKKYGAEILFLLGVTLFLFGGGFAPIFMTLIASMTATRINMPLKFWRAALPSFIRSFLGKIWLGTLIAFTLIFIVSVSIAIFGWPLTSFYDADTTLNILNLLSYIMLGFMLLSPLTGFAHDIQAQIEMETDRHG
jgi:hypothetical protein